MKSIQKILKHDLCLGCGMCVSIVGKEKCIMKLNEKGFYYPEFSEKLSNSEIAQIYNCCPGISIQGNKDKSIWGNLLEIKEAWSSNAELRKKSASGGVISTLAIYLLESKQVDAILQVGVSDTSYLYNELKVSRTKEEIFTNAQSRYAPALVFNQLKEILEETTLVFAFIGKPCDIAAAKNFLNEFPQYKQRITHFLAIFCAGMPSYNATEKAWKLSGNEEAPYFLKYRGDGWPGHFEARWKDKEPYKLSYNDSWGKILGKELGFRCKICPDGIGLLADIAVGDSWSTVDGYPDFAESDGRSFVMIRTKEGKNLFSKAVSDEYITSTELDLSKIKEMQKYQYERRKLIGWRLIPVQLLSGMILSFKGVGIVNSMKKSNIKKGVRDMLGTAKRFIKLSSSHNNITPKQS